MGQTAFAYSDSDPDGDSYCLVLRPWSDSTGIDIGLGKAAAKARRQILAHSPWNLLRWNVDGSSTGGPECNRDQARTAGKPGCVASTRQSKPLEIRGRCQQLNLYAEHRSPRMAAHQSAPVLRNWMEGATSSRSTVRDCPADNGAGPRVPGLHQVPGRQHNPDFRRLHRSLERFALQPSTACHS